MIPPRSPNTRELPIPSPAPAPRRSADSAREMLGALRERFGTAPLVDRRATGHLDAGEVIGRAPRPVDLERVDVPDALQLGPGRRVPTSKLRL